MGNFEADEEIDDGGGGDGHATTQASTDRATATSSCASSINVAMLCPLTIQSLKTFIHCQQLFPTAANASECENGIYHVAYLLETALSIWTKEAATSAETLSKAHSARNDFGGYLGRAVKNLALVCMNLPEVGNQQAKFVHWQNPGQSGRPVELDQQGRVKALVCVGRLKNAIDLSTMYVIHPDVGVPMLRVRGYKMMERQQMPPDMIRLQSMCEKALAFQSDQSEILPAEKCCLLCGIRVSQVPFPASLGGGDVVQCPCCLE